MLTPIAPPNHWPTRTTSSTSVTLTAGDATVLCSNTSDATVALPSAATVPHQIYTVKKIGANTATVTLDPSGSETIDGASEYVLYVVGDYVIIQSDGTAWRVIGGYLTPHQVMLYMTVPVECENLVFTRMPFDAAAGDVGGLANLTAGRIDIKRTGTYLVALRFRLVETTQIRSAQGHVYLNGSTEIPSNLFAPAQPSGSYSIRATASEPLSLAAGDYLDLYGQQINDLGNDYSTPTSVQGRPILSVVELR